MKLKKKKTSALRKVLKRLLTQKTRKLKKSLVSHLPLKRIFRPIQKQKLELNAKGL